MRICLLSTERSDDFVRPDRPGSRCLRASQEPLPALHALRGLSGQPGPRAENRERGQTDARSKSTIVRQTVASSENSPRSPKTQLAIAIAQGDNATTWARKNNVPRRTAQRWAREPGVRAAVERTRRRALDRAVGLMSTHARWAAEKILKLGEHAASEAVRLTALRAVLSDMIAVSKFGGLEDRLTEVEEQVRDNNGHADHAG
jgi:hypothetical protein